jgi:hypothetical protein
MGATYNDTMNQDLIFDYEKEALFFLNNNIFGALFDTNITSMLLTKTEDFVRETSAIKEIFIDSEKLEDTSEILLPKLKYAIRNEDIKLLDAILDGLKAAASVNFFQGNPDDKTISATIGVIAALVKLGRDLLKGVRLSSIELLVLIILRENGPSETIDIIENFARKGIDIKETDLLTIIGDLSQKKSILGTNVALVVKTLDGRWATTI